jgi:hypothetical protein
MNGHAETEAALPNAASGKPTAGVALFVDRILETICVALMLVAVGVACLQVVLRYGFRSGLPWPEELATWVFAWAVILGMAIATGRGPTSPSTSSCAACRRAARPRSPSSTDRSWRLPASSSSSTAWTM